MHEPRVRPGSPQGVWSAREVITSLNSRGETILLHIPSGTYLGLDPTAARIVALLNENSDPNNAAAVLSNQFDISFTQALDDVIAVVVSVNDLAARRVSRLRRPSVAGTYIVFRAWWRQSRRYRLATLQVALMVMFVEVGLKVTDVARLARWMHVPLATDDSPLPAPGPDDMSGLSERELRVYWAINWVMVRWLYDGTCLRRALTFGWFLRGRHPVLRLGMIDEGDSMAHAWIEVEGRAFNSQTVTGSFASRGAES
jgi:hypothetical protein